MSRRRKTERFVQQKINLDATTMARFARIHWDPTLQKVKYAAVSQVVNRLLADYVNRVEAGTPPQTILSDAEQQMEKAL